MVDTLPTSNDVFDKEPTSQMDLSHVIRPQKTFEDPEVRRHLADEFATAKPFPHVVISNFLGIEGLKKVREDLEKIDAVEKETDLFRFYQTKDLSPQAQAAIAEGAKKRKVVTTSLYSQAPGLHRLAEIFASDAYRSFVQEITASGELSDRLDLSSQVYPKGSHLLCHDDVIGTRKVSFIYYLTDPDEDWLSSEGGALELYPQAEGSPAGTPSSTPTKEVLPTADSLAMFIVEPGVSFHAVREVRGSRARMSLQGWLHAPSLEQTASFEQRRLATLQQILEIQSSRSSKSCADKNSDQPVAPESDDGFTDADGKELSQWLSPAYLSKTQLQAVAQQFEESSYAVLTEFLRAEVASTISQLLEEVDADDGFAPSSEEIPVPQYSIGVGHGWEVIGPPHLRRFLRYRRTEEVEDSAPSKHARLGSLLNNLSKDVFSSLPLKRWLQACTGLEPKSDSSAEVRRFRPGMDYTVAAREVEPDDQVAQLDVTLVFALGDGSCSRSDDASPSNGSDSKIGSDLHREASERWNSEEVGGFESYLAADDDEETVEAQEVYRGAESEGPLVNLPAVNNALCLVMRDSKTLRFVKYLSRDAPSSRLDISASFTVDAPTEGDSDDDEGSEA